MTFKSKFSRVMNHFNSDKQSDRDKKLILAVRKMFSGLLLQE